MTVAARPRCAPDAPPLDRMARALPAAFTAWLEALPPERWPDGRFLAHGRDIRAGVLALFAECETRADPPALWWADDVAALAARFAAITGEDLVDIRLEHVTDDACARFHIDNVPIRLITTYLGPGTEIVPAAFGAQARALQRAYRGPIERLAAGDIALFRGGPDGVVHRSPPIAGGGRRRALLCLNTRSIVSPALWRPARAP